MSPCWVRHGYVAAEYKEESAIRRLRLLRALLLRADPGDALDLERRPAALLGDFLILRVDEGAGRFVAFEPAEQFGRHAAVGAQAVVLINDVEKDEFALGIGSGFFRHARLLVDESAPVKRNCARSRSNETVSACDPMPTFRRH